VTASRGRSLDERLMRYLRGSSKSKGKVILLITVGRDGWPHVAMLSSLEVYATGPSRIRVGTYASSTTTRNMRERGVVTIVVVDRNLVCYVEGKALLLKKHAESDSYNSIFEVRVKKVLEDKLYGARITSGITFTKAEGVEPHERLLAEMARD
jgi:hypothetical protein